jgi:hypothetical protein
MPKSGYDRSLLFFALSSRLATTSASSVPSARVLPSPGSATNAILTGRGMTGIVSDDLKLSPWRDHVETSEWRRAVGG